MVAGVDDSPEGLHSARLACEIADRAGIPCHLVHAAREFWTASGGTDIPIDVGSMNRAVLQTAHDRLTDVLSPTLPVDTIANLLVRLGRAAVLIREVVSERDAGLVVLGAKHHPAVTRWTGGSTVHNVVRTSKVPVLVSCMEGVDVNRVLVAVDISYATGPTITEAIHFAHLFGAQLRILHVVEPLPLIAALPIALDQDAYYRLSEEQFEEAVAQLPGGVHAEKVLRRGASDDALAKEVEEWDADVLVVGSHGKGWVDRLLVGSTTERILRHLPTSTLVVPVADPNPAPNLAG